MADAKTPPDEGEPLAPDTNAKPAPKRKPASKKAKPKSKKR